MKEIKGSIWFSPMQSIQDVKIIGIVLLNNGFEDKAYIGYGTGIDEKIDEKQIAKLGAKFPVDIAKQLI